MSSLIVKHSTIYQATAHVKTKTHYSEAPPIFTLRSPCDNANHQRNRRVKPIMYATKSAVQHTTGGLINRVHALTVHLLINLVRTYAQNVCRHMSGYIKQALSVYTPVIYEWVPAQDTMEKVLQSESAAHTWVPRGRMHNYHASCKLHGAQTDAIHTSIHTNSNHPSQACAQQFSLWRFCCRHPHAIVIGSALKHLHIKRSFHH